MIRLDVKGISWWSLNCSLYLIVNLPILWSTFLSIVSWSKMLLRQRCLTSEQGSKMKESLFLYAGLNFFFAGAILLVEKIVKNSDRSNLVQSLIYNDLLFQEIDRNLCWCVNWHIFDVEQRISFLKVSTLIGSFSWLKRLVQLSTKKHIRVVTQSLVW